MAESQDVEPGMYDQLNLDRPHPARVYDYFLGGKDNFAADRQAAEHLLQAFPGFRTAAQSNRMWMHRAARYAAEQGITQFLDIGTSIPTEPNLHEVVQEIIPSAHVVYADNDPIVLTHARALLTSSPEGHTEYIDADLRNVESILESAQLREALDLDQPVGLLLFAIMHCVGDDEDPYGIVQRLLDALPSGSYLALSHLTGDFAPEAWAGVTEVYRRGGVVLQVRPRAQIERFFDGLELVEPGVQVVTHWRPDPDDDSERVTDTQVSVYGGVARKP